MNFIVLEGEGGWVGWRNRYHLSPRPEVLEKCHYTLGTAGQTPERIFMPMCQDEILSLKLPTPQWGVGGTVIEEEGIHSGKMHLKPCQSVIQQTSGTLKDAKPRSIMIRFAPEKKHHYAKQCHPCPFTVALCMRELHYNVQTWGAFL